MPTRTPEERSKAEENIGKETTQMYRAPEMVDLYLRDELTEKTDIWVRPTDRIYVNIDRRWGASSMLYASMPILSKMQEILEFLALVSIFRLQHRCRRMRKCCCCEC